MTSRAAAALVLAGTALFGTVGTARVLGPEIPSPVIGAARVLLGAVMLLGVVIVSGQRRGLWPAARNRTIYLAGVAQAGFQAFFLAAVELVGVATGTLVAIGCTPIIAALLTWQVNLRWLVATGISVFGLVLLVGFGAGEPTPQGLLVALGASASYAGYIAAAHRVVQAGVANLPGLTVIFAVATVVLSPALLLDTGDLLTWPGAATALYLALVPTTLAYLLFNLGLRGVPPGSAATLGLIEPVVAATLGVVVLDEVLGWTGTLGAVLVLTGLLVLVRAPRTRARQ